MQCFCWEHCQMWRRPALSQTVDHVNMALPVGTASPNGAFNQIPLNVRIGQINFVAIWPLCHFVIGRANR